MTNTDVKLKRARVLDSGLVATVSIQKRQHCNANWPQRPRRFSIMYAMGTEQNNLSAKFTDLLNSPLCDDDEFTD